MSTNKTYENAYNSLDSIVHFHGKFEDLKLITAIIPNFLIEDIKIGYNNAVTLGEFEVTFDEYAGMVMISGILMGNFMKEILEE